MSRHSCSTYIICTFFIFVVPIISFKLSNSTGTTAAINDYLQENTSDELVTTEIPSSIKKRSAEPFVITVPPTEEKWCGVFPSSTYHLNSIQLATAAACCSEHDSCSKKMMLPGKTFNKISNDNFSPIYSCECEKKLRECFNKDKSFDSYTLDYIYFKENPECITYNHHYKCASKERKSPLMPSKCKKYKLDISRPKRWQLVDFKTLHEVNNKKY